MEELFQGSILRMFREFTNRIRQRIVSVFHLQMHPLSALVQHWRLAVKRPLKQMQRRLKITCMRMLISPHLFEVIILQNGPIRHLRRIVADVLLFVVQRHIRHTVESIQGVVALLEIQMVRT